MDARVGRAAHHRHDREPAGLVHLAPAHVGRADHAVRASHTGELHPRTQELIEAVAERVEKGGIEAWFALDPAELLGAEAEHYDKVNDVMDVWADSGLSFECVGAHAAGDRARRSISTSKARISIAAGSTARC